MVIPSEGAQHPTRNPARTRAKMHQIYLIQKQLMDSRSTGTVHFELKRQTDVLDGRSRPAQHTADYIHIVSEYFCFCFVRT